MAIRGVRDTVPCRPAGPYADSQWQAEQRASEIARGTDMMLTVLRMATAYGEDDPGNVVRLIRAIDRGRFVWIGAGTNKKSLIHREDVARACITALARREGGVQVYNVSTPPHTMREVVGAIASALGRRPPRWRVPGALVRSLTGAAACVTPAGFRLRAVHGTVTKWLANDVYDAHKFNRTFGFETNIGIAEGMSREVNWYRRAFAAD